MGVIRHADAGYQLAKETSNKFDLDLNKRFHK
jgi:urocanate hydratase